MSPCDVVVPLDGAYRVVAPGIQASREVEAEAGSGDRVVLDVNVRTNKEHLTAERLNIAGYVVGAAGLALEIVALSVEASFRRRVGPRAGRRRGRGDRRRADHYLLRHAPAHRPLAVERDTGVRRGRPRRNPDHARASRARPGVRGGDAPACDGGPGGFAELLTSAFASLHPGPGIPRTAS